MGSGEPYSSVWGIPTEAPRASIHVSCDCSGICSKQRVSSDSRKSIKFKLDPPKLPLCAPCGPVDPEGMPRPWGQGHEAAHMDFDPKLDSSVPGQCCPSMLQETRTVIAPTVLEDMFMGIPGCLLPVEKHIHKHLRCAYQGVG